MLKLLPLALTAALLGGCATLNRVDSEVSTYSQWPAQRRPTSYVFERLPSQQSRPGAQQALEDAARPALEAAGFATAADPAGADFSVQVGARTTAELRSTFDDPFWWNGGLGWGGWGHGFGRRGFGYGLGIGVGPSWYGRYDTSRYEHEVAVLIRDRKSGAVLYEARANSDSLGSDFTGLLPAMYAAAMKDFPNPGINPRRVTVDLSAAAR